MRNFLSVTWCFEKLFLFIIASRGEDLDLEKKSYGSRTLVAIQFESEIFFSGSGSGFCPTLGSGLETSKGGHPLFFP